MQIRKEQVDIWAGQLLEWERLKPGSIRLESVDELFEKEKQKLSREQRERVYKRFEFLRQQKLRDK